MKKISLKIKLTLKYTGCIFVATGIALFFATMISGTDAQTAKAMAKVILPIVFIASLAIGYFLVREVLKRTADLAESAAEICRTKDFSRQLELEESDAEFERLQLTLNELLEDVREEGHFAENVVQEMWMPVSVILTRSAWCLGDWRLSQRQRWQIELVQKKAQILSDFIQEVSFFAKADQGCQPAYKKRMNISELTTGIIEGQISRLQEADEPVQIEYEIEPEIYAEVDENCYRKMLLNLLENSITSRLFRLEKVFNQIDSDVLIKISGPSGQDEIGSLMDNYNRMADRMNSLIDTAYRCRLKEQKMDIARQNAELMALYSQINPHFLFNALESIRMHSILKKEEETADMIQKLAIMVRQNVDWSSDSNTIKRELAFVEAYLSLQKYRFGERLSYQINAQEDCQNILVPKLTITTFVENACVHGIEAKSFPGWIFVRVYTENDALCMEIEDTGGGMDEAEVERIQDRMRNASLKMLKEKGRVGMVNTCLRIRMMTEDTAQFSVESEPGIGTLVSIRFPLNKAIRAD